VADVQGQPAPAGAQHPVDGIGGRGS
jgi:hypothetical protein